MSETRESVSWLAQQLAEQLSQVFESMTGDSCPFVWEAASESQKALSGQEETLWWEQGFSLARGASLWVGASESVWAGLAGKILQAAGVEVDRESARNTYLETLNQTLAGVARSLSQLLRREVTCEKGLERSSPPTTHSASVVLWPQDQDQFPLLVNFSQTLLAVIEEPAGGQEPASQRPAAAQHPDAPPAAPPASSSQTLELLYDVELPVSVSFGRAELPLKDVLKLTSGSIVELNRAVSEPVEVIVNNCVIARGEVVVVEGNYGVRIDQIISRQERLRTLK